MANPPIEITRRGHRYVRLPKSMLEGAYGRILIDPNVQFGEPCIAGTRIPARTIYRCYKGGDSIDYIARSYDIDARCIEAAIAYVEGC
jgi:uncharacterized protein (DUF433 family)